MKTGGQATLLRLYDKLTGLLDKLPGGIQKPVLRELEPIRAIFLEQRPARIELAGGSSASVPAILAGMGAQQLATGESLHGWRTYSTASGSTIEILDARNDSPGAHVSEALAHLQPDLVLLVEDNEPAPQDWSASTTRALASGKPILAVSTSAEFQPRLATLARSEPRLAAALGEAASAGDPACPESICANLPACAQLEFARFTGARRAQAFIASKLLKSFSAVCGVVGLQPIPLADLPILISLQSLMVGLIIHTTGKPATARLVGEFLAAMGLNTAAAFALREGARAAIRIVPFWGSAVSGFVAGAGTYAIGRAAIAYFIDDSPLAETRKLFRRALRKDRPPALP